MILELPPLWPHQQRGLDEVIRHIEAGRRRICLTAPTGAGKSRMIVELIQWFLERGQKATLYTNRNLLREQTSRVLTQWSIDHGVRAAGEAAELEKSVQIVSVQSESRRVFGTHKRGVDGDLHEIKAPVWTHHKSGLVLTDEIHMGQGDQHARLRRLHDADGAVFVDVTATPIDLRNDYDVLVQAGTTSECRACGSLLPAKYYAINEPDVRKVKANKAGEIEIEPGRYRSIWIHSIVGSVIENYRRLNPDGRPTILFAPGVKESIWFAEQMTAAGHRWAHIDGQNVWLDGEMHKGKDLRDKVIDELRNGKIAGVSNRFVLREGIDIPELYLGILATVFGSLQQCLQSVGRVLRNDKSLPGHVVLQDHGGNFWRWGSANEDRYWELGADSRILLAQREARIRNGEASPIICPKCGMVRLSGPRCLSCGSEIQATKSRQVVQEDGSLRQVDREYLAPRIVRLEPDTLDKWKKVFHRARNSRMTFRQAEGLFVHEYGYWPPRNLPLMPRVETMWFSRVADVPKEALT